MPQSANWRVGDVGEDVGKPGLRSISLSLALMIKVLMKAARSAPRSDPATSHDLLPSAKPRNARSAALLKGMVYLAARLVAGLSQDRREAKEDRAPALCLVKDRLDALDLLR